MGRRSTLATIGLLAATATAAPLSDVVKRQQAAEPTNYSDPAVWDAITPSAELKWVKCFEKSELPNLLCAKLTVPYDYKDPSVGTLDIAFIKYVHSEDAEDLLYNPGGPGGHSIPHVAGQGPYVAKNWGYNFVTFDVRGVGLTPPEIKCAPPDMAAAEPSILGASYDEKLKAAYEITLKANKACSDANRDTKAKYIGTSAVVQDMMHYVELAATAKGQKPEEAKINYWGISYGTIVGQTLAAMYPDRLNRVLVDGNVYGPGYYQGWIPSSTDDFAHSVWTFAKLCFEAGPEYCKLAEGRDSLQSVKARFDAVITKLDAEPVEGFDGSRFVGTLGPLMNSPRGGYGGMVNFTLAFEGDKEVMKWLNEQPPPPADENFSPESLSVITATDIAGRFPWNTYEGWRGAYDRSMATVEYSAQNYLSANGLIGLAMDAFIPPPSQFFPGFEFTNTSAPVLFVNTAADPVTPRSAAIQMSRLFNGASYFIQDSPGHGFQSSQSKCTDDILKAYFKDAKMPEPGTWCPTDVKADYYFGGPNPRAAAA